MNTKVLTAFALLFLTACTKEEITPRDYPRVMTRAVTNIANGGATFKGEVTYATTPVLDHGFIWTSVGFPTLINGEKKSLGAKGGVGAFEFTVSQGLALKQKYSVRAYAMSSEDVVYGNIFEFVSK